MNTQEHKLREHVEALKAKHDTKQITREEFLKEWKAIIHQQAELLKEGK